MALSFFEVRIAGDEAIEDGYPSIILDSDYTAAQVREGSARYYRVDERGNY